MRNLFLSLSVLALLSTTSCNKDNGEPRQVTPTKENLAGTYKITSVKYQAGNSAEAEVFNNDLFFEACQRDDHYKLNADLSYQVQDAGTQCTPPTDYTGDWAFINATTVEIDGEPFTIRSFTGTTLVVSASYGSDTITLTYVRL